MKAVIRNVQQSQRLTINEIDISTQPDLENKWGLDVPVLLREDRVVAKHKVSSQRLIEIVAETTSQLP
jgi:hypothetical protein